jgi:hypothetical protein
MASTPTTNLRLEQMATGENDNTWGTKMNVNLQLLEDSITKRVVIPLTNTDVTLSTVNYAADQARCRVLVLTGTLTGNCNIIVPALSHEYLVQNLTVQGAFTITIKTAAGTGVLATPSVTSIVYCDGTNVVQPQAASADSATLGGLLPNEFARLNFLNQFTKGNGFTFVQIPDGTVVEADCAVGDRFAVVLGGNRVLSLTSPNDGQTIELWCVQDATGGRAITFPSNVLFQNGVAPALSGIANGIDVFRMTYNQAQDLWISDAVLGASGGASIAAQLPANESNVRLYERVGSPIVATSVNVTVPVGVIISSLVSASPALDLRGFPSGSTINVINNGLIVGCGGDGGDGNGAHVSGSGNFAWNTGAGRGQPGGDGILCPGSGVAVNIYNANGRIWGGGGGGGGGGAGISSNGSSAGGGGGGGGAGGGRSGFGGNSSIAGWGADGLCGSTGLAGVPGTGGAGNVSGGGTAGTGGDGGDFGAAGTAGGGSGLPGTGGAAGKAIEFNGGSASVISGAGSPNIKGAVS